MTGAKDIDDEVCAERSDLLVYYHPDDPQVYVGRLGDAGWWSWPAEAHGWERARQLRPDMLEGRIDALIELLPENARLALMLSGYGR